MPGSPQLSVRKDGRFPTGCFSAIARGQYTFSPPTSRRFLSGKHHPLEYTTRILLVYFKSRKRVGKPRPRPLKPPNLSQT